jgi:hypothetical protein
MRHARWNGSLHIAEETEVLVHPSLAISTHRPAQPSQKRKQTMKAHQRLIATAAIVGAALLSPVCAEGAVRAAASAAPSLREREEFGGAAVPADTANVVALRAPAGADAGMEEFSGRRRLMWWNWIAANSKSSSAVPPWLVRFRDSFPQGGGNPNRVRVISRRPGLFVTKLLEFLSFHDIILT